MLYHIIAFIIGVILDWIIGDPVKMPHPVRWIGNLISKLTEKMLTPYLRNGRNKRSEKRKGLVLVMTVVSVVMICVAAVLIMAYYIHAGLGIAIEAVLTCYILAAKSLYVESMRVSKALQKDGLEAGRQAVSMIVGRDTDALDENGVIKAAVETVAENTSDGVIAPLIYTLIGGPVLGFAYKAVNTMDSMVGYHNDKYEDYGYFAAKLDDVVNYLPARISAWFMIIAAGLLGKDYSAKRAAKIFRRDRYNHKSPNSAQTESACAGALGVRLAGDAFYFGKLVEKPYIGDDTRAIEIKDIKRAGVLMFLTEILVLAVCIGIYCIFWWIMNIYSSWTVFYSFTCLLIFGL